MNFNVSLGVMWKFAFHPTETLIFAIRMFQKHSKKSFFWARVIYSRLRQPLFPLSAAECRSKPSELTCSYIWRYARPHRTLPHPIPTPCTCRRASKVASIALRQPIDTLPKTSKNNINDTKRRYQNSTHSHRAPYQPPAINYLLRVGCTLK